MEQETLSYLPMIGVVQHGEKLENKVTEYGYFIAKSNDTYMKPYLNKFDQLFKGKQSIHIQFFNETPLIKKYVRNNQSGEACSCIEGSKQARQKVKNGWQSIDCDTYNCQYRQKNAQGKCACNRIGFLKFFLPEISTDRIWLMRITGQTSINLLDAFINLQKLQGNSVKGHYILFLKSKQQTSKYTGRTYNNYILDIVKKDDFISNNKTQQINQKQENLSTGNTQNVNNKVDKEQQNEVQKSIINENEIEKQQTEKQKSTEQVNQPSNKTSKTIESNEETKPKKQTKSKVKKAEETPEEIDKPENYYVFESLSSEIIKTKSGEKEYAIGKFYDIDSKAYNIILKPEHSNELQNCELGTLVEFPEIKEVEGRMFAIDLKFIQKMPKNIAA